LCIRLWTSCLFSATLRRAAALAPRLSFFPMETLLQLPESSPPTTVAEILSSLRKEHLDPRHESKSWGDWIHLECYSTVISIECNHGLSSSATIEHGDGEEDGEPVDSILRAFGRLGWHGIDEDGEFPLV
jgi:hypothetical protein